MGGKKFTLTGEEYSLPMFWGRCMLGVTGLDTPDNLWVLGDVLLRKYYSVFDVGRSAVGMGLAK